MKLLRYALSIFMVFAGLMHFINPDFYLQMMPPWLPAHGFLVALSGIIEIALGLVILRDRWVYLGSIGVILLLLAVYPANIFMAMNAQLFPDMPAWMLWARLPFQFLFLAWAWSIRHTGKDNLAIKSGRQTSLAS